MIFMVGLLSRNCTHVRTTSRLYRVLKVSISSGAEYMHLPSLIWSSSAGSSFVVILCEFWTTNIAISSVVNMNNIITQLNRVSCKHYFYNCGSEWITASKTSFAKSVMAPFSFIRVEYNAGWLAFQLFKVIIVIVSSLNIFNSCLHCSP